MKIAYIYNGDSQNIRNWSGTIFYIAESLKSVGYELNLVDNLKVNNKFLFLLKKAFYKLIVKRIELERELNVAKSYGNEISQRISDSKVLISAGSAYIAFVEKVCPIIIWADISFQGFINFYPDTQNYANSTLINGNEIEKLAFDKADYIVFSSDWAANEAKRLYNLSDEKVKVIPFGANIEVNRTKSDIESVLEQKDYSQLNLLFLGVDWYRKGGDKAYQVTNLLNEKGIKTTLHVVGCKAEVEDKSYIKEYGFIDKSTNEGRKELDKIFEQTHFLIVPSIAEAYGIVFAEASSYGVPSISTKSGGITTVIKDRINGITFSLDTNVEEYCNFIVEHFTNKEKYYKLALSSFDEYENRLNWHSAGLEMKKLIDTLV
ncbi:MAG: glycosyltransferase family 4 protein [Candidatus Kapabacteria bacterium]|nr:glycosyltransferase family 4 protein [Candidatus Kapabacteria bacterium]